MKIEIDVVVKSDINTVWNCWSKPEHVIHWNFASSDWCCPKAESNFNEGGQFSYRMESRDGIMGFDFMGTFTNIEPKKNIQFKLDDGRMVQVHFSEINIGVLVQEIFEAENIHSVQEQKDGWKSILENFKSHVETLSKEQ